MTTFTLFFIIFIAVFAFAIFNIVRTVLKAPKGRKLDVFSDPSLASASAQRMNDLMHQQHMEAHRTACRMHDQAARTAIDHHMSSINHFPHHPHMF